MTLRKRIKILEQTQPQQLRIEDIPKEITERLAEALLGDDAEYDNISDVIRDIVGSWEKGESKP